MKQIFSIQPLYIVLIGITISIIMVFENITRNREDKEHIYKILEEEALSLAETIERSSANIILSSDEIEMQITNRLLTAGRLIAWLDSSGILLPKDLKRIANENNIFSIYIFDRNGKRILSNYTPIPAHQSFNKSKELQERLKPIFDGTENILVLGVKPISYEPGERFTVAVKRTAYGGGAIVLNIDITNFIELKKNIGIGKLIRDLGNNSGIEYAALQDAEGIIAASDAVDQLPSFAEDTTLVFLLNTDTTIIRQIEFHNRQVFEALKPLIIENSVIGIFRIGLALDEVRAIEAQTRHRNLMRTIVLIFVILLTVSALMATQNYRLSRQRISAMETFTGNILEQMRDAVVTIDAEQRITIFNREAERIFGIKEKEAVGKTLSDIESSHIRFLEYIFSNNTLPIELTISGQDGNVQTVSVTVTKLPASTTAVIRDLTESKRLQQEFERREKLSAMGELAAGVAHEIRNPLNAISMIAQRYEKEFAPKHNINEFKKITRVLKKESTRVNEIIQQFLKFARPPKLKLSPISTIEFTSYIVKLFESQAKAKGVRFTCNCTIDKIIQIDQSQMTQALLNILQNALDATKKGEAISLQVVEENNLVVFRISDTGEGIPTDQLSKIFNLYYTTKPDGNGMGLAITHQIVSQHKGTIEVQSKKGKGTTFSVRMPFN